MIAKKVKVHTDGVEVVRQRYRGNSEPATSLPTRSQREGQLGRSEAPGITPCFGR